MGLRTVVTPATAPAIARGTIHDRGFQFVATSVAEDRTLAGIEQGRIFHHRDCRNYGINAAAAGFKHRIAGGQRLRKRLYIRLCAFHCQLATLDGAGAAMNHQPDWRISRRVHTCICHNER